MRITRDRSLADTPQFMNPETEAHRSWCALLKTPYAITRADAYRDVLNTYFAPHLWPGGYSAIASTADQCDVLCAECARKIYVHEHTDINIGPYFDGPTMFCEDCGAEIESADGDPNESE